MATCCVGRVLIDVKCKILAIERNRTRSASQINPENRDDSRPHLSGELLIDQTGTTLIGDCDGCRSSTKILYGESFPIYRHVRLERETTLLGIDHEPEHSTHNRTNHHSGRTNDQATGG